MAEFVHLHVHSEYSLLDGLSSCRELARRTAELGMPALALTDHGTMYGVIQFYKACQAAGIKPIIGMEAYLALRDHRDKDPQLDRRANHLVLLAQNRTGYQNLMRLATVAQLEGFYYRPRVDKEMLAEHAEGLIALSGCGSSEVSRLIKAGQLDAARRVIGWYRDVFPGRYYLELQEHGIPELTAVNHQVVEFAREFGLPLVATNDVHYTHREEAATHDVLLCIQTGKTVNEPKRMRMDGDSYYLKSAEEMSALFPNLPDALTNTLHVAEMCGVELEFGNYHLPVFEVPEGYDVQGYLRHLCEMGLRQKYPVITPQIQARLDYELDIIHRMGFDTYFLIVWDLCRFSQENGIWWNVRGSGNGSIVAYSLGITNLEPLQHGLIFERFLNPGRVTMPDIDLDYPDDQRDQLIRYTIDKYGYEQVAQIITFGTLGAKAAIRDVGRALDYPLPEVDRIARLVPSGPKVKLAGALHDVPELQEAYAGQEHIRRLIDTARGVEGNLRHASTHAAGVIVSDVPLVEYAPLNRPTRGGGGEIGVVTQYTMEELEELGLLKIDFLGLSTLTVMRRACELIRQRHGLDLDLLNIPTDHPSIYALLSRGDVMGVFQVEGQGMRRVLMKMQPTKFDHVMATISLFRPGPMEYIDDYIDRLHGRKPVEYRHPSLEPILQETYGVCIAGDAIIVDVTTGQRRRLDECGDVDDLIVQGVDSLWQTTTGRVTRWMANGEKPVCKVTLRNGAHIQLTYDHRVLTEEGWCAIGELSVGDHIATPQRLIGHNETLDRDKLRELRPDWQEIISMDPAGVKPVYDLTVEGCHNFVANNILVHNCVYQEQIMRTVMDIAGYTPPDADGFRKSVAKKKKDELLKNRTSFVEGAMKHGKLPHETAEAIFGDFEAFARYGFPKGHAADYAVLTCQTAYLKANYPVEYMAALLSVERHNTEKVGLLIAECRRMGIEVLPPDINSSGLDFTIEEQADGTTAIRFGLGAVKNVGEGPVHTILSARQAGGPFNDLGDFCRRVDMRNVNRRALESLIKVGALRPFGVRSQLLPIVDRIVGLSATVHRAKDVGQMSLFGEATGVHLVAEETLLPPSSQTFDVPQKEILAWEKELVGVYVSEHPLTRTLVNLQDTVTAYAGSLSADMGGQQVTVAGMVQRVRRHYTKKGDEMAFVTLEDLQGTCDVVVFPRIWGTTKHLWEPDRVLVLGGKVDAGRRDVPNLLCNWAKLPEEMVPPTDQGRPQIAAPSSPPPPPPPPTPPTSGPSRHIPREHTVHVTLTRSGEQTRDVQTLRQVHSLLVEHSGEDRFVIRLTGGASKPVELAFPNDRTCYTPELTQQLAALVGADAVRVEVATL
jgi:DNA polymerase III alpha subunit